MYVPFGKSVGDVTFQFSLRHHFWPRLKKTMEHNRWYPTATFREYDDIQQQHSGNMMTSNSDIQGMWWHPTATFRECDDIQQQHSGNMMISNSNIQGMWWHPTATFRECDDIQQQHSGNMMTSNSNIQGIWWHPIANIQDIHVWWHVT